jgi:hypothetical protein
MPYSVLATSKTPALIVYLLDISRSMNQPLGGSRKIDTVLKALDKTTVRMVQRSTKGMIVAPRYRIAMYGYHKDVVDLLGGIQPVSAVAETGIPKPTLDYGTQTARAFEAVERLLQLELPHLEDCPAPLVCHMTDGLYGGADPEPVVARIKEMSVPDGPVLVENIFISKSVLRESVGDSQRWTGVTDVEQLGKDYARKLFAMSSAVPDTYLETIGEFGYAIQPGARMLFPGDTPDLVELGFAMSGATPVSGRH